MPCRCSGAARGGLLKTRSAPGVQDRVQIIITVRHRNAHMHEAVTSGHLSRANDLSSDFCGMPRLETRPSPSRSARSLDKELPGSGSSRVADRHPARIIIAVPRRHPGTCTFYIETAFAEEMTRFRRGFRRIGRANYRAWVLSSHAARSIITV